MVYITAIMEQHPVPQDITGFKFKLVGDMTLKQFGELAAGAILAYIFYASNWHPFLKWPLVILFGSLGVALAFLPIEERPLDLWIINFLKAIYRPTIFVWKKNPTGGVLNLDNNNYTTKPAIQTPIAPILPIEEVNLGLTPWPFPKKDEKEKEEAISTPNEPKPPVLSVDELANLREKKLSELEEAKKKLQEVTKQAKEETFQTQVGVNAVTVDQLAQLREEKLSQTGEAQLNELINQNKNLLTQIDGVKTKIDSLTGVDTTELKTKLDLLTNQKDDLSAKISTLSAQLTSQGTIPQQPRSTATSIPGVRVMNRINQNRTTISLSDQPNII